MGYSGYKPPFDITAEILGIFGQIQQILGQVKERNGLNVAPVLRKTNRVKTIRSTCAIEGNSLGEDVVTALIDKKRVLGPAREILEINNALAMYGKEKEFSFDEEKHLLQAHKVLMDGLSDVRADIPGKYRTANVGVMAGEKVIHMAPPHDRVAFLMKNLFAWVKKDTQTDLLLRSAIFHYEFEFIHPFFDGNGRLGRFWQYIILLQVHPIFRDVPVESIIYQHQSDYYRALQQSQTEGSSTAFIEFSLFTVLEALTSVFQQAARYNKNSSSGRIARFVEAYNKEEFTRTDYLEHYRGLAPLSASRDLAKGVAMGLLHKIGDKRLTKYVKRK